MKSVQNESWIDIPENLYKSDVPKTGRIVIELSDIETLHQEAISKYYNPKYKTEQQYWMAQIDAYAKLLNL